MRSSYKENKGKHKEVLEERLDNIINEVLHDEKNWAEEFDPKKVDKDKIKDQLYYILSDYVASNYGYYQDKIKEFV